MESKINHRILEYYPLSMFKLEPENKDDQTFELRNHVGKVKNKKVKKRDDLKLPDDSLLNYGKENPPALLYCITMYNEPFLQLLQSLAGVYRSYYELCAIDETFKDRCHVTIIIDGYDKITEEFLMKCEKAGIYNEFKTKRFRTIETPPGSDKPVHRFRDLRFINTETMNEQRRVYGTNNIVHCFSRLIKYPEFLNALDENELHDFEINQYSVHDFLLGDSRKGYVKNKKFCHLALPIHFAIKHKNQGKIESHKWFFKGFCEYMNPKYAQIIDCGSIPLWNSISYIIMHMEAFKDVGGACGEIEVMMPEKKEDGSGISFIESVLLRAQYVEYKLSHYLDKATETLFGFVSVLPGAFSTFRWECIKGQPLDAFLKGSTDEFGDISKIRPCFDANKYLAEDRIMCLEIIAKRHNSYIIHYVPGAKCLTDPPLTLTQLVRQRRRWFNGSMFASIYVLQHMCRVWGRSKCSCCRNFAFMILYFYMFIQMLLSFVLVGSFYGVFSIFIQSVLPNEDCMSITAPANAIENLYIMFLFLCLLLSSTVEIQWAEGGFRLCSIFMGLFTLLMVACSVIYLFDMELMSLGVFFFIVWAISFIIPLCLNCNHLRVCDFIKGVIYALYLSPTYVNIFTIYAISNIHDVTWGSRPTVQNEAFRSTENKKMILYKNYRSRFLVFWTIVNVLVGSGLIYLWESGNESIIFYIGGFLVFIMFFRILLSTCHKCKAKCDAVRTRFTIRRRKSTVFDNVTEAQQLSKEDVFVVYFDDQGGDLRISQKNDPAYKISNIKSSIKDENFYRGFSIMEINQKHRISQGLAFNPIVNKRVSGNYNDIPRQSSGWYLQDSHDVDSDSSSTIHDPIMSGENDKYAETNDGGFKEKTGPSRKIKLNANESNDSKLQTKKVRFGESEPSEKEVRVKSVIDEEGSDEVSDDDDEEEVDSSDSSSNN